MALGTCAHALHQVCSYVSCLEYLKARAQVVQSGSPSPHVHEMTAARSLGTDLSGLTRGPGRSKSGCLGKAVSIKMMPCAYSVLLGRADRLLQLNSSHGKSA